VLDADRATHFDDPLFRLATYVVFSSEALRATAGIAELPMALRRARRRIDVFLAVTNGPDEILWIEAGAVRACPCFRSTRSISLGAGRRLPRRLCARNRGRPTADESHAVLEPHGSTQMHTFWWNFRTPMRAEVEAFLADKMYS